MTQTYFLGANTRDGFFSLYDHFPPDSKAFLHILKSGPGTGKSGFMRRIGQKAEDSGLDVHYVLCSGDPESLDGIYVPALQQAWVDGTAPHVIEPGLFGADSDYINLGVFLTLPFSEEEKNHISALNHAYKEQYRFAYKALSEYAVLDRPKASGETQDALQNILDSFPHKNRSGKVAWRFLSAISCEGFLRLTAEVEQLCSSTIPTDAASLTYAAKKAQKNGQDVILCPSALDPKVLEMVLLPEASLAFTAIQPIPGDDKACQARSSALASLQKAKEFHDMLEGIYKLHIDFHALTDYTERVLQSLFS